jgi:GrpB-like predicted nucleotidyltransferase (UPF0157 family)
MSGWEFIFEASKPERVHRYFWCATVMDWQKPDLWWCDHSNKFLPHGHPDLEKHCHSNNSKPIRTLRAFRRFLRKHPELRGRRVRLVSRYVGFDVEAVFNDGKSP